MKKINKVIAFLLVIFLLNTVSPECLAVCGKAVYDSSVTAFNKTLSVGSSNAVIKTGDSFNSAVSDLIKQDQNLFCEVVIDLKENTIKTDDEEGKNLSEYGLNYNDLDTSEVLVPVIAVLNETGTPAVYDEESGEIVVSEEESYSISQKPEVYGDPEAKNVLGLATTQEAEKELLFETDFHDGKIIITAPCQTARLIVHTKSGRKLSEFCGAETVVGNGEGMYVLQYASAEEANDAYSKLSKLNVVESVSFDKVLKTTAVQECNGKEIVQSDRFKNYLKESNMDTPLIAAVIDTGADITHEMISDRIAGGYNFVDNSPNVEDKHGHGTHVAGIIASNTNKNVKIMPVKVLGDNGSGTELAVAMGIDYAVSHGANVLNLSLGGSCSENGCVVETAIRNAMNNSVTVCVAAGNSNDDTSNYCPARIKDCITVASGGMNGSTTSYFSNYGEAVDVTAPGEYILSAKTGGGYVKYSGTSMATPFVTAAAALLLSENPMLTPAEVESKVRQNSSDMLTKGYDKYSGAGYLNFGIFFGDNIPATTIRPGSASVSLVRYNDSYGYKLQVFVSGENGAVPTDRTFGFEADKSDIISFDGSRIYAMNFGVTQLHLTLANGSSCTCKVSVLGDELWINDAAENYAGGDGSEKSPYLISNAEELSKFALDVRNGETFENKHLMLTDDIDLSGKYWITATKSSTSTTSSTPNGFMGVFNGNNHKIINLTIYNPDLFAKITNANDEILRHNNAFIGKTYNAVIRNLGLENMNFTSVNSGPLVGTVYQGTTIENCYTSGFSNGYGLVYRITNYNIVISNCYSDATVTRAGIAKEVHSSLTPNHAIITNTFFCGEIIGNEQITNHCAFVEIADTYSISNKTTIGNCFCVPSGLTDNYFVGENIDSEFKSCYFGNSCIKAIATGSNEGIEHRDNSIFKDKSFYTNESNWSREYLWDFENVWEISPEINNGYPYLKNNAPLEKIANATTGTWLDYAADSFEGGNGTEENPFLIKTAEQLARISYLYRLGGGADTCFKLVEDIELSAFDWFPIGAGFALEGSIADAQLTRYSFYGNIDGDGHTIKGLRINRPQANEMAFICSSEENYIRNINFTDVDFNVHNNCGVIASMLRFGGNIENCNVSGKVLGSNAGGIARRVMPTSSIVGCSVTIESKGSTYLGAIANLNSGTIKKCTNGSKDCSLIHTQGSGYVIDCLSKHAPLFKNLNGGEILRSLSASEKYVYFDNQLKYSGGYSTATKTQLKTQSYFKGWDFENVWILDSNDAYPVLRENSEFSQNEKLPAESWADVADYNLPGYGKKDDPYLISTPEQLAGALLLFPLSGTHFKLINDIDLAGKLWPSSYNGTWYLSDFYFDGNNKTVFNMTTKNGVGLFGTEANSGEISNLNIENIIGRSAAGIIYRFEGLIKNCSVNGNIESVYNKYGSSASYVTHTGGICCQNDGVIEKCTYIGTATSENYVGGMCGTNNGKIKDCYVGGILSGSTTTGFRGVGDIKTETGICTSKNIGAHGKYFGTVDKKDRKYFEGYDFENVWDINPDVNDGYPFLRKAESKTISYNVNGGAMPEYYVKDYILGTGTSLPNPIKEGVAFGGWYFDEALENKAEKIDEACQDNITLYAKWVPGYIIRFNSVRTDFSMDSISCPTGENITLPKAKLISNCRGTFDGWSLSKDGRKIYNDASTIKDIAAPGETIDLYPVWKNEAFFIKYNFNGNGEQAVLKGYRTGEISTVVTPSEAKEGCYFAGWSKTQDGEVFLSYNMNSISSRISDDYMTELFAVWKELKTYRISFDSQGGSGSMTDVTYSINPTLQIDNDAKIKLNNQFFKEGCRFIGWATEKGGKVVYPNGIEKGKLDYSKGNVKLYAVWGEIKTYTISFNGQGGSGNMKSVTYTIDPYFPNSSDSKTLLNNLFFRNGYQFAGWATEKGGAVVYPNAIEKGKLDYSAGDVTLYAVWKANKYTISFASSGGSGTMKSISAYYNKSITLPECSFTPQKGYHFSGWAVEKGGAYQYKDKQTVKNLSDEDGAKVILYAAWAPNKYTVTFDANGGKGKMGKQSATYNESLVLNSNVFTAPTGYHFAGWATSKSGKVVYKNNASVKNLRSKHNDTITLYAVWSPNNYAIVFKAGKGSGTMKNFTATYGKSETLPKNTFTAPKGYRFAGWSKTSGGKVSYKNGATVKNLSAINKSKVELFAVWEKYDYAVKFNANGGSGKTGALCLKKGESATLKNSFTAPTGKHFAGWATSENGKVKYTDKSSVKDLAKTGSITLYAVWKANSYTISFNKGSGSGTMKDVKAVYGKSLTLPKNSFTALRGYKFAGWATSKNGKVVYKNAQSVKNLTAKNNATVTLYAVWKKA